MDYETLLNVSIGVFEDIKSDYREIFVIHNTRNDILEFVTFQERYIFRKEEWHVSFNYYL